MRRVPIRLKLTGALVFPLIGLFLVTWSEVRVFSMDDAIENTRAWPDDDHGGEPARAYTPSLDALDELGAIRAEVDAAPDSQRSPVNAVQSGTIFDRYTLLMSQLVDANRETSFSIDDDVVRRGVDLHSLTARQTDTMALLVKDLMIPAAFQQDLEDRTLVRAVARELAELRATEQARSTWWASSTTRWAPTAGGPVTTSASPWP